MADTEPTIQAQDIHSSYCWSARIRGAVSVLLVIYLFIVVMGPLSNPIASEHLTGPIGRLLAPVHQTLFLGHGYRFFGPDPGPGHLLVFKVTKTDGHQIQGRFPDRNQNWPRLMYHRWFMLSETIYEEHVFARDEESHRETLKELDDQIAELNQSGRTTSSAELQARRDQHDRQFDLNRARVNKLLTHVGQFLLIRNDGQSIELFVQERLIPLPQDVAAGVKLNDRRYLAPPQKIAELARGDDTADTEEIHPVDPTTPGTGN